ncbi:complement component C6-like [Ambystoma mexicanum]|uniref:complement component C6-like n=1 Tax=Ambystoma mexicanum TaxID=8296 RepID=UPI0037E7235B
MAQFTLFLFWALFSTFIAKSESCFCDLYAWSPWSSCSKTCNYGTQIRSRQIVYNEYYLNHGCDQLCTKHQTQACNQQACPIHCQIGDFGPWSECDPCVKNQYRVRSLLRPSQFGGQGCSEQLADSRRCVPSKLCNIEEVDCKARFKCDTGRCIDSKLECNGENDCGDNSDERNCGRKKQLCARRFESVPSVQLMGNGYNFLAGKSVGEVLDNSFYGGKCNTIKSNRTTYRLPANLANITFQEDTKEDDIHTSFYSNLANLNFGRAGSGVQFGSRSSSSGVPVLWGSNSDTSTFSQSAVTEAVQASHKKDSNFIRVHKKIALADFTVKQSDLHLADVFLKSLNSLPLEYNFALYSRIFDDFGTHYFTSGSVGGTYDLLYQFSAEKLKTSGVSHKQSEDCSKTETREQYLIFFTRTTVREKCVLKSSSTYTAGSFLQSSEKSISLVKGGRTEYAAALAWKKEGAFPDSKIFMEWVESTKDNPVVLSFKLAPILDLVKDVPCAVTKRRNLQRAVTEYMERFDPCRCAPCPNNARPVLSETQCLCVCQSGTFGENCERRAPDYTSVAVDGYWSCWSEWSSCDASFKRKRTRSCNNPSPLNGGKECEGEQEQVEDCHFSIFMNMGALCINDDEEKKEVNINEPEPTTGCTTPQAPENGYFRIEKKQYSVSEEAEVVCLSGYELVGYQFFQCLRDGSWRQHDVQCRSIVCKRPSVSEPVIIVPYKSDYKVSESIRLKCPPGFITKGPTLYTCGEKLSWEPPLTEEISCLKESEQQPSGRCKPGLKEIGSECVCMSPEEDCGHHSEDLCIFDATTETSFTQSSCQYLAEKCLGEKQLHFLHSGACKDIKLNWVLDRIKLSTNSTKQEPCGYDMCYDWEKCSDQLSQCLCLLPYQCPPLKDDAPLFCIQSVSTGRKKSADLCALGATKCAKVKATLLHDGKCVD